ncbi:20S proteasome subunit [Zalerion maritima]|uniref:Proteasome subunit beta n=1 Tax=Zalerion maritima TaxID=339359 RepID=A0AAD5RP62_9PEZI|nr:20S proteasome subunit [Zalerion maritima]
MDHRPQNWGRPRDDIYGGYDVSYMAPNAEPNTHTQSPVVTGTSVVALKYKDGVIMAADNLASYGSLARFPSVQRLMPFADTSVLGFSGDVSDMQYISRHLTSLSIDEAYGVQDPLNAANLHRYLSKLLYSRRSKFDPLWNNILIAGFDSDDKPFLASADLLGTTYSSPSLASGYGSMLAQPIMRKYASTEEDAAKLTKEQAIKIVKECMKVLFYRDARSLDKYSLAVVTRKSGEEGGGGVQITQEKLEGMSWKFADRIKGYGTQTV